MEPTPTVSDAQPTGSSPAPVRADAVLESLSHEEKQSWQKTGALPTSITVTNDGTNVDSSSTQPGKQADDKPAASSAEPKKVDKRAAEHRGPELDAEIATIQEKLKLRRALREELATLDRPAEKTTPPASSAEKPPNQREWERFAAMADAPQEAEFSSVRDYTIAMSLFVAEKRDAERAVVARQAAAQTSHLEGVKKVIEDAKGRVEKYREIDPDLESKIDPQLVDITPASLLPRGTAAQPHHVLMENILRSDFTPQLLVHFSTPEGQAQWLALCKLGSQPDAFLRAFGRIEARFEQSATSMPVPQHVSSAPKPPAVLGTRPAESTDPVDAAIRSKDVGRYIREQNKRELAALRG